VGYSDARSKVINLALDRIDRIREVADVVYKTDNTIKVNQYFKNTIGITDAQGKVEDIELWFAPNMSPYLKIQPLHASQKVVKNDKEGVILRLQLVINYEFVSQLLSNCPHVRVLKPVRLRNKLEALLRKALELNTSQS